MTDVLPFGSPAEFEARFVEGLEDGLGPCRVSQDLLQPGRAAAPETGQQYGVGGIRATGLKMVDEIGDAGRRKVAAQGRHGGERDLPGGFHGSSMSLMDHVLSRCAGCVPPRLRGR